VPHCQAEHTSPHAPLSDITNLALTWVPGSVSRWLTNLKVVTLQILTWYCVEYLCSPRPLAGLKEKEREVKGGE